MVLFVLLAVCSLPLGLSENIRIVIDDETKKWEDARDRCEEDKGRLVIIDEKWKMDFVKCVLENNPEYMKHGDYWTDGREKNGEWLFLDDSHVPMGKGDFWMEDKPGGTRNKQCARLKKKKDGQYLWNDKSCSTQYRFICEYDYQ